MLRKGKKQGGVFHPRFAKWYGNGPCFPWELIHSLRSAWPMLHSPAQIFIFLVEGHSRDSVLDKPLGPAQPWADAQALQAIGWALEHYSLIDLPMVLCRWWQAFGQLSNMAYSCILPRKEKRIIYHRYSLTFFFSWLSLWLPSPSNTRPVPPALFGYLWPYLLSKTRNSAHVRTSQEGKKIFKLLCSFHKSALIAHDEIWHGK